MLTLDFFEEQLSTIDAEAARSKKTYHSYDRRLLLIEETTGSKESALVGWVDALRRGKITAGPIDKIDKVVRTSPKHVDNALRDFLGVARPAGTVGGSFFSVIKKDRNNIELKCSKADLLPGFDRMGLDPTLLEVSSLAVKEQVFLCAVSEMCRWYREKKETRFSDVDRLALRRAYQLLDRGTPLITPFQPILTSPERSYSTYLSLADPGPGHLRSTVLEKELLAGTIVHVEYIDRDGIANKDILEAYRMPAIRYAARIRLQVGDETPCSVYFGRPVFQNKDFKLDLLKTAHTSAAACSALFSLGVAECKIAMDALTTKEAILLMQVISGNVIRNKGKQRLSAAFNLNSNLQDDRGQSPRTISNPIDIAELGIGLVREGHFNKITWDGASSKPGLSTPLLPDQVSPSQMLSLVHQAHEFGLETYISAGMQATHMEIAAQVGVGGVGIGTRLHEPVDEKTGLLGPLLRSEILACLNARNAGANSIVGRAARRLAVLDWLSDEKTLAKPAEKFRQRLFGLLRQHAASAAGSGARLTVEKQLEAALQKESPQLARAGSGEGAQQVITPALAKAQRIVSSAKGRHDKYFLAALRQYLESGKADQIEDLFR